MGDLDKLIAAVEAGKPAVDFRPLYDIRRHGAAWMDLKWHGVKAYHGSFDAALKLREALLPGWDWQVGNLGFTTFTAITFDGDYTYKGESADPAIAILLAILRALQAQSTPPISPEEAQFDAVRHHERFGPLDEHGNPLDPRRRG